MPSQTHDTALALETYLSMEVGRILFWAVLIWSGVRGLRTAGISPETFQPLGWRLFLPFAPNFRPYLEGRGT